MLRRPAFVTLTAHQYRLLGRLTLFLAPEELSAATKSLCQTTDSDNNLKATNYTSNH